MLHGYGVLTSYVHFYVDESEPIHGMSAMLGMYALMANLTPKRAYTGRLLMAGSLVAVALDDEELEIAVNKVETFY